jgi:transcriptional regulator with XRE-family HTH domain
MATYGRRRVPGLRREEVAMLAGVSTDYYARLERGNLTGVSDSVLEAIARALHLDEAEHAHLHDLARAANTTPRARRRPAEKQQIRPVVQRIIDGMTALPAIVLNGRLDLLAANRLGVALYSPVYDDPSRPVNLARFCFLNPHATALYPHWDEAANTTVAMLRIEAGRNPYDRALSDLIGELSTRSEIFRNRWAAHNVVLHRAGAKQFRHPVVGDLSLAYEVMELSADTGLSLTAYSPEPDSPSQDGLALLASWAATQDQSDQHEATYPVDRRDH